MTSQDDCRQYEQYLGEILQTKWQSEAIDRAALARRLILSQHQLDALISADSSAFHTYGIYLRALRYALEQAGLLSDPKVLDRLDYLVGRYSADPQVNRILEVRRTVNRKLDVVPIDREADKPVQIPGVLAFLIVATMLLTLAAYLLVAP